MILRVQTVPFFSMKTPHCLSGSSGPEIDQTLVDVTPNYEETEGDSVSINNQCRRPKGPTFESTAFASGNGGFGVLGIFLLLRRLSTFAGESIPGFALLSGGVAATRGS